MKKFNITGTCIPHLHYMVNIDSKVQKVIELINEGLYFVISRPRQYGKTTLLSSLYRRLSKSKEYILIKTSFEGLGDESFESPESFASSFLLQLTEELETEKELLQFIKEYKQIQNLKELNIFLSDFVNRSQRKVILMIDEVDKASNFNLFISFLGMLRDKYLKRADGVGSTFHSVILAGLHDIKNIKLKIHSDSGDRDSGDRRPSVPTYSYNSPWNIATEFKVDMSFSPEEIETMLVDYFTNSPVGNGHVHYLRDLRNEIYKFTSGYPFLVSKICKLIDEELDKDWSLDGIQKAISLLLKERNTLFDDLIKNIENYTELQEVLKAILIDEKVYNFNIDNPVIDRGTMYGIFKSSKSDKLMVHNKIFEIRIYNYLISKLELSNIPLEEYTFQDNFINPKGDIDMEKILLKFQEFIKDTYSNKNETFYETHGRLLLVAFIKPIINGSGFYYLESQHSYERRSDMIITFNKKEYILELKLWYGKEYHEKGLEQLASYLESRNHTTGYLVAFNFNKNKEFTNQWNTVSGKKIFEVLV